MNSVNKRAILLVGHGSRKGTANLAFEQEVDRLKSELPTWSIHHSYIELAEPNVQSRLSDLSAHYPEILVMPLMLSNAGHVKNDLAIAINKASAKNQHCKITLSTGLNESAAIIDDYARLIGDSGFDGSCLLVIGRGSSDISANSSFYSTSRQIGEASGIENVFPCFLGIAKPSLEEALTQINRMGFKRFFAIPYLLYSGILYERVKGILEQFQIEQPFSKIYQLPIIGGSKGLTRTILEKIDSSKQSKGQLECATCQYRVPLGKLRQKVGGLQTLLWSIRHTETHSQVSQAEHSHKPIRKHILVCANHDCANRGSIAILHRLRRLLRENKIHKDFKVTRTSCMGKCGEGPTVAVYPDGIWYREMNDQDVDLLVEQHLLNDKLLGHKVDLIM